MKNRVVITGVGLVSPIGNTKEDIIKAVKTSKCGIDNITYFDTSDFDIKLAAEVKELDSSKYLDKKEIKRMDKANIFGLIASIKAMEDSKLDLDKIDKDRVCVYVSSGIGGLSTIESEHKRGLDKGFTRISPFFIPMAINNMTSSLISMRYSIHGSSMAQVTACASSSTSIGEGFRSIKDGYNDIAIVGGSEASITPLGIGGFSSMKALSTSTDKERASIPFDKERQGFVMGEGAGILILESLENAIKRKAHIYGEIVGYGSTSDAEHITRPNEEGKFAKKAMENALKEAGVSKEEVGYINAHGTSTYLNDMCESKAINALFKDVYVSSSKSQLGHLLGASGSVEAIISLLSVEEKILPPNINYKYKDEDCNINLVKNNYIKKDIKYFLSNSLGFGGHNVSLLFKSWEASDEI